MKKRQVTGLSVFSLILLLGVLTIHRYAVRLSSLPFLSEQLETFIRQQEDALEKMADSSSSFQEHILPIVRSSLPATPEFFATLRELEKSPATLFVVRDDSVLFWSKSHPALLREELRQIMQAGTTSVSRLSDSWYEVRRFPLPSDSIWLIGAILLSSPSSPEDGSFPSGWSSYPEFSPDPPGYPVRNSSGGIAGYLRDSSRPLASSHLYVTLVLFLFTAVCWFVLIYDAARHIARRIDPWAGAALLFVVVLLFRHWSEMWAFVQAWEALDAFSPVFQVPGLESSVGALLIDAFLLLGMILFFHETFQVRPIPGFRPATTIGLAAAGYFSIITGFLPIIWIVKNMVLRSERSFDFESVFQMDQYQYLAIFTTLVLLTAHFLFTRRMMMSVIAISPSGRRRLPALGIALFLVLLLIPRLSLQLSVPVLLLIFIAYVALFDLLLESNISALTWAAIYMVLFSGFTSFLFFKYSIDKTFEEELEYARLLSTSQDGGKVPYDYAVFQGPEVIRQQGQPELSLLPEKETLKPGQRSIRLTSRRADLIYRSPENQVVIIGKNLGGYIQPFSLFSFVFISLILAAVVLLLMLFLFRAIPVRLSIPVPTSLSLRNRIQLAVIALILISFVFIGFITYSFFKTSAVKTEEARLLQDLNAFRRSMEKEAGQNLTGSEVTLIFNGLQEDRLSGLQLFDRNGRSLAIAGEKRADAVLLRMDSYAFHRLNYLQNGPLVRETGNGNILTRTAYLALRDEQQRIFAFLGLPFPTGDSIVQKNTYDLLSQILNFYAFFLIIASVLAIFVGQSITKPIGRIGEKLKNIKLGKNEPLEWNSRDEVGRLIQEYNRMIRKLEENTEKLKQSEREGAWREMAKQVAHEIKNPLTPMKLSIQYLQHAYRSNPSQIEPTLRRVAQTLIEQIDGLSRIASEFSDFAKMPRSENETLILQDLVRSIYDLYNSPDPENPEFFLEMPSEPLTVFADRNQLQRVLTNLVKNAIQAIPSGHKGRIELTLSRRDDLALIRVTDNGAGIPEEVREKVFSPNFTTKTSGMGLGLAISKNIIDAAGGSIYFRTETEKGTTFFIELPLNE